MEIIKSISNVKIKEIKKLRLKKYRDQSKLFIVEGEHLLEEAIKTNTLKQVITTDLNYQKRDYDIIYVSENVMKHLSELNSISKYLGICIFNETTIALNDHIVVLDGIQDPGNLGTIIRNGRAFGLKNFVLSPKCADIYNPKVIQASQGALFKINFVYSNLVDYLHKLKDYDYTLIGTALSNSEVLTRDNEGFTKMALVFGSEGQGISEEILNLVDKKYYIAINDIESLNVACASAIVFYQFLTKK